jgi:hypothetical protein
LLAEVQQLGLEEGGIVYANTSQLNALREAATARQTELLADPRTAEALDQIEAEWQRREKVLAELTPLVTTLTGEDVESIAVPKDAAITGVTRADGLVTTEYTDNHGNTTEVVVKEANIWAAFFIMAISDSLLGTHHLQDLLQIWTTNNITAPLLENLGIDTTDLRNRVLMGGDTPVFSKLIEVAQNSEQVKLFFEKAMKDHFLYAFLKQIAPEDRQKIFNSSGTKPFGGEGFLGFSTNDRFELDQSFVDQVYARLTDSEKRMLQLPEKMTVNSSAPVVTQA